MKPKTVSTCVLGAIGAGAAVLTVLGPPPWTLEGLASHDSHGSLIERSTALRVWETQLPHHLASTVHHPLSGAPVLWAGGIFTLCVVGACLAAAWHWRSHLHPSLLRGHASPSVWWYRWHWKRWAKQLWEKKDICPVPLGGGTTPAGGWLRLKLVKGMTVTDLQNQTEDLSSAVGYPLEFRAINHKPNRALVHIRRHDLLAEVRPWPLRDAKRTNFLDGVPLGWDVAGATITWQAIWNNLLVGGIPGAGKTVAVNLILSLAALDPRVHIHAIDGKGGLGFAGWRPVLESFITENTPESEAKAVLYRLRAIVEKRIAWCLEHGVDRIPLEANTEIHLVPIDEYNKFARKWDWFESVLLTIVEQGRAAGVIVVAATQRPSHTNMKTDLRAIISHGLAFLCTESVTSDMILRPGMSKLGYDASKLPESSPGVGYLLHETSNRPVLMRAFNLTADERREICARAAQLRASQNGQVRTSQNQGQIGPDQLADARSDSDRLARTGENGQAPTEQEKAPRELEPHLAETLQVVEELGSSTTVRQVSDRLRLKPETTRKRLNALVTGDQVHRSRPGPAHLPDTHTITPYGQACLNLSPRKEPAVTGGDNG
jgi:S-DNA-T family DNA segregation ATPase FtsK/SpoIIIE